jgi:aldehyde:ferredoxin oxidoreductase
MFGFYNRLLTIDASSQSFTIDTIPDPLLRETLGGKGLATYLLLKNNPPGVNPLAPENRLIFATGPVSGSPIWGSCRYGVYTKSPQTGVYAESYSGGTVGDFMAKTGFDAVVITGASPIPSWLEISEDGVIFHSAEDLWGMDTYQTETQIKQRIAEQYPAHSRAGVVVIGPAGEHGVTFSVIENDYWRSAGRTGTGAVMGSKRIKAIAFRGGRRREHADPELLREFAQQVAEKGKDDPGVKAYKSMGTTMMVKIMNQAGAFPTRYWHRGSYEDWEKISSDALHQRCEVRPHACLKCFIACGRLSKVLSGRHAGLEVEGPEYETIYAFGGLCEVASIEEIMYLNDICDRMGMDTISAGNLAAFTIEASRQGRTALSIDYGEVDAIASLLEDIAYKKGIGETLSKGIRWAAKEWGMEDQAIHVKGLEPAGYDPRVLKGMGLSYGTSDRGACHLRTTFYKPELSGMIDPNTIADKAAMLVEWEDRLTIFDSLILCRFYRDLYPWEQLSTILEGTTGLRLDQSEMQDIAGNIADHTRQFNLQEGLTSRDDHLPRRFHKEALESGKMITAEEMETLLQDYYCARNWTREGIPRVSH